MRRYLLLFAVVCFAGLGTANAQCLKSAKASCAKKSVKATSTDAETFAMNAALEDETVERKVCSASGKVSYHQSSTCAKSGAVSVNEVKWCTNSNKFVNVSPSAATGKTCSKGAKAACSKTAGGKACCSGAEKAACCAKKGAAGASAVKASMTSEKKACTKGAKKCSKPCGSKAKASSASIEEVKAVKVSNEG